MSDFYTPQNQTKQEANFGKWHVSLEGDMTYDSGRYYINSNRLKNDYWIAHLFEKGWIDWNEFIPAYFQALKNAGIQYKRERVFY